MLSGIPQKVAAPPAATRAVWPAPRAGQTVRHFVSTVTMTLPAGLPCSTSPMAAAASESG